MIMPFSSFDIIDIISKYIWVFKKNSLLGFIGFFRILTGFFRV